MLAKLFRKYICVVDRSVNNSASPVRPRNDQSKNSASPVRPRIDRKSSVSPVRLRKYQKNSANPVRLRNDQSENSAGPARFREAIDRKSKAEEKIEREANPALLSQG